MWRIFPLAFCKEHECTSRTHFPRVSDHAWQHSLIEQNITRIAKKMLPIRPLSNKRNPFALQLKDSRYWMATKQAHEKQKNGALLMLFMRPWRRNKPRKNRKMVRCSFCSCGCRRLCSLFQKLEHENKNKSKPKKRKDRRHCHCRIAILRFQDYMKAL